MLKQCNEQAPHINGGQKDPGKIEDLIKNRKKEHLTIFTAMNIYMSFVMSLLKG